MKQIPPYYLQNFTQTPTHHPAFVGEKIFRRSKKTDPASVFDDLSTQDVTNGVSVNRSKLSALPSDVLWEGKKDEHNEFVFDTFQNHIYEFREGYHVFEADCETLTRAQIFTFELEYDPLPHNLAHANIQCRAVVTWDNLTKNERKAKLRDLKAFLASFFKKVEMV